MSGTAKISHFADALADSGTIYDNLVKSGFDHAAIKAVRKKTQFDPAEFKELLVNKQWLLAREWMKADRDETQAIMVDNFDYFFDNLFTPENILHGLYFARKTKKRNMNFEANQRFKLIAKDFLTKISDVKNPLLVACLFAELLHGEIKQVYIELATDISTGITEVSGNKYLLKILYDEDDDGRWLLSIIHALGNTPIIETEGVKTMI